MQGPALCASETLALHHSYLYAYALSRLRQPSAAEDLVQDTLLAALEGRAPFKDKSKLRTWLTSILKHKIIDWHRSEARNPARASVRSPSDTNDQHEDTCDALFDSAGNAWSPFDARCEARRRRGASAPSTSENRDRAGRRVGRGTRPCRTATGRQRRRRSDGAAGVLQLVAMAVKLHRAAVPA
jgi:RNA polymerase sigma factor (sigma-70 family)